MARRRAVVLICLTAVGIAGGMLASSPPWDPTQYGRDSGIVMSGIFCSCFAIPIGLANSYDHVGLSLVGFAFWPTYFVLAYLWVRKSSWLALCVLFLITIAAFFHVALGAAVMSSA